ncbi:26S proteasome non-ATPase regulatory subunit 9 [Balamuthia mandrillaris]
MEEAKELLRQKDQLEKEIEEVIDYLTGPDMPGLTGGLVDKEGFPIENVELIIAVREARHKLACLQTDHKNLMKEIEQAMYDVHAKAKREGTVSTQKPATTATFTELLQQPAIAEVDQVFDESPAKEAGFVVGDFVIRFGSVEATPSSSSSSTNYLPLIGTLVSNCEGKPVDVFVKRRVGTSLDTFQIKRLILFPKKWKGRGLVGCHLVPARD